MKVILDCNIWISFLIGHQAGLMQRILMDTRYDVIVCDELLDEIQDVCSRPKIKSHVNDEELEEFFRIIYAFCQIVKIEGKAEVDIRDPKDLYLLSLAESTEADYIVSGDADLLELKQHKLTNMISLAEFKTML